MIVMRQWNESLSSENLLSVQTYKAANRTTFSMRIYRIGTGFPFFRAFTESICMYIRSLFIIRRNARIITTPTNNRQK